MCACQRVGGRYSIINPIWKIRALKKTQHLTFCLGRVFEQLEGIPFSSYFLLTSQFWPKPTFKRKKSLLRHNSWQKAATYTCKWRRCLRYAAALPQGGPVQALRSRSWGHWGTGQGQTWSRSKGSGLVTQRSPDGAAGVSGKTPLIYYHGAPCQIFPWLMAPHAFLQLTFLFFQRGKKDTPTSITL